MALRGRFGDEFKVPERGCMRAQNSMMPRENIFNENGTYRNSPQADASEFWGKILNALVAVEKQLDGFGPTTLSFLEHELLGGIMRTRKTCANPHCGEASDVCSWRQLHKLPVPQNVDKVSFQQLWDNYMKSESVDRQLGCCPALSCGHRRQDLFKREPPLLFVVLEKDGKATRVKSHAAVDFPRYLQNGSGRYGCVGIIHHQGGSGNGGHYTATCRTSDRGAYRNINDDVEISKRLYWSEVTQVRHKWTAHSLLYVRVTLFDSPTALPYKVGEESQVRWQQ